MSFRKVAMRVGIAAAIVSLLASCSPSEDGGDADGDIQPQVLVHTSFTPNSAGPGVQQQWWMDQVTERTGGAITFETNWSSSLCGAVDAIACIGDGRADLGIIAPQFDPAQFPLSSLDTLPFQIARAEAHINVWNRMLELPEIRSEFENAGLEPMYTTGPTLQLLGMIEPISDFSDLAGASVRVGGALVESFEALGASPVTMGSDELYEALQRGVVEGVVTGDDTIASARLYEIVPNFYDAGATFGAFVTTPIVLNLNTWEGLQPEVQDIMREVSQEAASSAMEILAPVVKETCETILASATIESLTDETGWAREQTRTALDTWVAAYTERTGADPSQTVEKYRDFVDEETAAVGDAPITDDNCIGYASN